MTDDIYKWFVLIELLIIAIILIIRIIIKLIIKYLDNRNIKSTIKKLENILKERNKKNGRQ